MSAPLGGVVLRAGVDRRGRGPGGWCFHLSIGRARAADGHTTWPGRPLELWLDERRGRRLHPGGQVEELDGSRSSRHGA